MTTAVPPSGDRSGAADAVAVNAVLALPGECVLSGQYFIDRALLMSSNTTLTLDGATVMLVDGADDNIVRNADQSPGGQGNTSLRIVGNGRARLFSDPGAQSGGRGQGLLFQNVTGLEVSGITIGPTYRMAAMQYGVRNARWSDVTLAQDASTPNQDGIDVGPGCRNIRIDGVKGRTGDDCFSIFAKNTGGNTTPYTDALSPEDRNVEGVYISDVSVDVGISPVRVQAGDGSRLRGVYVTGFTNLRKTTAAVTGGPCGVLQFGSSQYVTNEPDAGDMSEIYLSGYSGPGTYILGAASNFSQVGLDAVTLTPGERPRFSTKPTIVGVGHAVSGFVPTFHDVTITDVTVVAPDARSAQVLSLPAGASLTSVDLFDIAVATDQPSAARVRSSLDVRISSLAHNVEVDVSMADASDALPGLGASVRTRPRKPSGS